MSVFFTEAVLISVLAAMVRIATPLILAALGELVAERAGVLNLGVEGMMLMGAFCGFMVAHDSGSLWLGVLGGMAGGLVMALIFSIMTIVFKLDQIVSGLALNMLGAGLSLFWYREKYIPEGSTEFPTVEIFTPIAIPVLSDIPYLGPILFEQQILTYIAFLMIPTVWYFLYRTKYGLEIRCIGENPSAIDTKGLNVALRQHAAVLFGGAMAGLGGCFLTIATTVRFVPDITGGRGWLAIVIVIASGWHPLGILFAAMVFAFLDALQLQIQGIGVDIPYQLLLALPYVVAMVAVIMKRSGSGLAPAHLGVPFIRQ